MLIVCSCFSGIYLKALKLLSAEALSVFTPGLFLAERDQDSGTYQLKSSTAPS